MITLVSDPTPALLAEIQTFCTASCLGIKALGPLLSYGTEYAFVSSWIQRGEQGELVAFINKCYETAVVYQKKSVLWQERDELTSFLSAIGYQALVSSPEITGTQPCGLLMQMEKGACCKAKDPSEPVTLEEDAHLHLFYDLLCQNNPGYFRPDYSAWLVDFSHRVRHQTANTVLLYRNGVACATAAALTVADNAVFLGAVSTNPNCRGRHYASACLRFLCGKYENKRIYLMCKPEKQLFYEKMGFEKADVYAEKRR